MKMSENLPKRKDLRLKNYDYSECGAYFITICTKNKEKLLWNGELDVQNYNLKLVGGALCAPARITIIKNGNCG
jgi:hypothetical protein